VRWYVLVAALALSACQPNRFFSGWVPYWGGAASRQAITDPNASALFSDVSLMWYSTNPDGSVSLMASASELAKAVTAARASGIPVLPTIFDSNGRGVTRAIIHDPVRRAAHVRHIVDLVTTGIGGVAYDGIDLDYEAFAFTDGRAAWPAIRPDWITFVTALGDALHAKGKLLAVTVPPVWNGGASGYTVYAQHEIAPAVDRLRFMVYDWSDVSPGPMAPKSWVQSVLAYSSAQVPTSKLQLGIPAYGRVWSYQKSSLEVCPDSTTFGHYSINMSTAAALAAAHHATPIRDSSGEITFAWDERVSGRRRTPPVVAPAAPPVTVVAGRGDATGMQPALRLGSALPVFCTVRHVAFVPDAVSMRASVSAALAAHWSGAIVWALGFENTALYRQLATLPQQRPTGALTVRLDAPSLTGTSATVTGLAEHPDFDLPLPVTLTLTNTTMSKVVVTRTLTARASRVGVPAGLGPFHGISATFASLPAGSYRVCARASMWGGVSTTANPCQTFTVTFPAV
jgi:spore germination protein YaaH